MPSVLTLLACYGSLQQFDLSGLRTVIFAGEVFPPKHLARLIAELPHPRYLNWYGPTETNVCTAFEVPAGWADAQPAPIGKACANTEVFAVTSEGRRVSRPGEEGELYVRGPSLMRGYWGQPAKTSEVLVRNPFRAEYGELVYRTGDLVTLEPAGNYAYLGRRDSMVKIRGYRVELGEVEATLYRHPAIREAAVLPVPDELLGSRLRAVITADGARQPHPRGRAGPLPAVAAGLHGAGTSSSSGRRCREPRPARSTGPASPRSRTSWSRPETADGTSASRHTRKERARVETVINDYISRELVPDAALLPLANDTSLLDSGILDSLSLLRLVVFLEERFGITMGDADLLPENFASVNAICAYLRAREPGKEAAHG